ncbi:MAG: DUF2807 domain-containing protein, partial [Saprospiraceae bacterium]|nr:DUF2807 domain-containing protein [Saprospiraceae bacterium]
IKTQSLINATVFKLILSGAGDVDLNLSCDDLNCVVSGAGDAKLKGKTNDFTCVISGAGDLKAYDFIAEKCKIVISGSGDAKIYINNEISATVTGAGDLKYKGSAKITKQIVSGAGSIKKAD